MIQTPSKARKTARSSEWGCYSCGSVDTEIVDRGDDDGWVPVRQRRCKRCGDTFVTEERRLSRGVTFWQRADKQRDRNNAVRRKRTTCRLCGGQYGPGGKKAHLDSDRHVVEKQRRAEEARERAREKGRERNRARYHADPEFRRRQIAAATERTRRVRAAGRVEEGEEAA